MKCAVIMHWYILDFEELEWRNKANTKYSFDEVEIFWVY